MSTEVFGLTAGQVRNLARQGQALEDLLARLGRDGALPGNRNYQIVRVTSYDTDSAAWDSEIVWQPTEDEDDTISLGDCWAITDGTPTPGKLYYAVQVGYLEGDEDPRPLFRLFVDVGIMYAELTARSYRGDLWHYQINPQQCLDNGEYEDIPLPYASEEGGWIEVETTTTAVSGSVSQVVTLTIHGDGGTFKLNVDGINTDVIEWDGGSAAVQAAVDAACGAGLLTAAGAVTLTFSDTLTHTVSADSSEMEPKPVYYAHELNNHKIAIEDPPLRVIVWPGFVGAPQGEVERTGTSGSTTSASYPPGYYPPGYYPPGYFPPATATNDRWEVWLEDAIGGEFTLTLNGEAVTFPFDTDADTIGEDLSEATELTVTVTGSGTPDDPWEVTVDEEGPNELTGDFSDLDGNRSYRFKMFGLPPSGDITAIDGLDLDDIPILPTSTAPQYALVVHGGMLYRYAVILCQEDE